MQANLPVYACMCGCVCVCEWGMEGSRERHYRWLYMPLCKVYINQETRIDSNVSSLKVKLEAQCRVKRRTSFQTIQYNNCKRYICCIRFLW